MKAAVIVFPGANCERDVAVALEQASGRKPIMVWHRDGDFEQVDLVVLPGGFAYGDYLRAGAMAAHSPVMRGVKRRAERGVPTIGICNGFQVLTEAGLLPGALMRNASLQYVCKDVHCRIETGQSLFTSSFATGETVRWPVGHHDGNYFADAVTLDRLEGEGRVAFRYAERDGSLTAAANPNGSARNIAGIFNETKSILGLMPHPERLADPALGGTDGVRFFKGLVEALR
jgi:phosphoribosylformylglycinamidine synthase subunit PurQ / glutaminase